MNKYDKNIIALQCYPLLDQTIGINIKEYVRFIEKELECELPTDYIEFLSTYGGYTPDGYAFFSYLSPYPRGEKGILNVFFGMSPGNGYDLVTNYKMYKGRMPSTLLPIADDPGGNIICLSVKGESKGTVYFWDHEEECKPNHSNLYIIGGSFDNFINSLELEGEEQEENESE